MNTIALIVCSDNFYPDAVYLQSHIRHTRVPALLSDIAEVMFADPQLFTNIQQGNDPSNTARCPDKAQLSFAGSVIIGTVISLHSLSQLKPFLDIPDAMLSANAPAGPHMPEQSQDPM